VTWQIILNPAAGRTGDVERRLRDAVAGYGIDGEIVVSSTPDHLGALVSGAVAAGTHRFAAVGGDGTAHLLLNALMRHSWASPPTLAIVPAGSGSDFIRTFALPRTVEGGVEVLAGEGTYRCDVGLLHGSFGSRFFLNAANVGVAAASVLRAESLPKALGGVRYTAAFWLALARFPPKSVVVNLGRRTLQGDAMNVVVSNGQFFGGGLNVAPQAAVMDGLLDVQVFLGPRRRAFTLMPRVIRGLHLRHPAVLKGRTGELSIDAPDDWPVEADGEMIGHGSVRVTVVPGAIDFKI
jgi:diacylglycerol kinase (ATP)